MIRNSRNANMLTETTSNSNHQKFGNMLQHSGPNDIDMEELSYRFSNGSESATPANFDVPDIPASTASDNVSPQNTPSWDNQTTSPLSKSPWTTFVNQPEETTGNYSYTGLMGSLVREEGHIYSLATLGDLLYTGSDSKNIRVWKNQKEFSGFKSNSGLVKAIVIAGERIFTGHQDGKIRLWKASGKNPSVHKRIGTLPTLKAYIKTSMNPSNYVEVRRNKNAVWIKHFDAISCLNLSEDKTLLYSASWDKTVKVWRVSDSKCLESVTVHDDAVNAVVSGFDGLVFTGSADGTVKVWRREKQGKGTKHFFSQILLKQDCAITALAVNPTATVLYGGSSDGLVNFWEREKLLSHGGVIRGHKLAVLCLATAGNMVFSGSADTTICVWRRDQVDGQHTCLSVLRGHSGPVKCLAVEEDREGTVRGRDNGAWIAYSGSLDKSVKIWRVSPEMTEVRAQRQKESGGFAVEQTEMLSSSRGISSHG